MSAAADHDTGSQTAARFHRYVDLPAELRIKIIKHFIANFRNHRPAQKFAPFTVIHSEWQHELEYDTMLFGTLYLGIDDLPAFRVMFNQHRCHCLSEVIIHVHINNTAMASSKKEDDNTNDTQIRLSRAHDLVVKTVASILESVESAILGKTQSAKPGLELNIAILVPKDEDHSDLHEVFCAAGGIDCDFSRLVPAKSIRTFSRLFLSFGWFRTPRNQFSIKLTPSSLLTLIHRLPNLEHADFSFFSAWAMSATTSMFKDPDSVLSHRTFGSPWQCLFLMEVAANDSCSTTNQHLSSTPNAENHVYDDEAALPQPGPICD